MAAQNPVDSETLATLKEVMEGDFQLLIDTFTSDADQRLTDLRELLARRDAGQLRACAHSFKGSCSNIGAPQLAQLCARVEDKAAVGELDVEPLLDAIEREYGAVREALAGL